jgi:hypothetical protein
MRGLVRVQMANARFQALWLEGAAMDTAAAVQLALRS